MTFGCRPHGQAQKYYKREGDGFPQVWALVNLMNLCLHVVCPCTKNAPTMHFLICTNQLVIWSVQVRVNN